LVSEYVDANRQSLLKEYPDFESFKQSFSVGKSLMKIFLEAAEKAEIKMNEEQFTASEPLIKIQIKGLIAQKLYDITSYYVIANESDPEVMEAVKVIQDDALFRDLNH